MRWTALIFLSALASSSAIVDSRGNGRIDQDEARAALRSGEIKPLERILATVRESLPGEIVKVKLDRENGRWLYEFRVIDRKGRLREIEVDASTGSTIRIEGE